MVLITYKLLCGHLVKGPYNLASGTLPCPAHHFEPTQVIGVQVYEWHVACRNCNYGRWSGQSSDIAEVFATGHRNRNHGHLPYARYIANPDAERIQARFDAANISPQS